MSNQDLIEMDGLVVEAVNGLFRVQCDSGITVVAKLKKRLNRHKIRVVLGDRVTVGVSPYDPKRGFIIYRFR